MENKPLISVCMITYNHSPYIAQAIESVLMQKTTYAVELVIGEDASPDETRLICKAYADRYPDKIRLLPAVPNMGSQSNFIRTLYGCQGQYIALLEGDDYWTDPNKLQKQVDLLEQNPNYIFSFHNVGIIENDNLTGNVYPGDRKELISLQDVFKHDYYQTCSIVFKSAPLFAVHKSEAHEWIYNDITLFALLLSGGGQGRYIAEVMAAYRVHPGGVWSMGNTRKRYNISLIAEEIILDKYYRNPKLRNLIAEREQVYYEFFMNELAKSRELRLAAVATGRFIYWTLRTAPTKLWECVLPPLHYLRAVLLDFTPKPGNVIVRNAT